MYELRCGNRGGGLRVEVGRCFNGLGLKCTIITRKVMSDTVEKEGSKQDIEDHAVQGRI